MTVQVRADVFRAAAGPTEYFPLDTGESAPTINSYAYPVRSVRRYGALPTASAATNSAAFQAAVNACNAVGGGTIFFPDGTYQYDAAINLGTTGNISLVAERGGGKVTLQPTTTTMRGITCGGPISDVLIDGINIVAANFAVGIVLGPVTRARIQNLTISGCNTTDPTLTGINAGIYCGFATDVTIDNCAFSNNGQTTVTPQTIGADIMMGANGGFGDLQRNITITRCKCRSTTALQNIGLFDVSNALIMGNECSGSIVDAASNVRGGYGIMLYNTTSNPDSVHHNRVLGNTIHDTEGMGIYFQGSHYSIAANNILQRVNYAQNDVSLAASGIALASCHGSIATGNVLSDVYQCAITVSDVDGTHSNCIISNNTIDNVQPQPVGGAVRPCIYIRGTVGKVSIIGNEISNISALCGIGMYDNGVAMPVVNGLRIMGNSITGARVIATGVTAGAGTVAATKGVASFSTSQAGAITNGSVIVVGTARYVVDNFNGTNAATLLGAAPTFTATAFNISKAITISAAAGAATFSSAPPNLANGDKIIVGLVGYTVSALAGTTATLVATVGGASPTFAATPFVLPKVTSTNAYGILLLGAQESVIEGNNISNISASCIRCTNGSAGGSQTQKLKVINNTCVDANSVGAANFGILINGNDCIVAGNHSAVGTLNQQYGGINALGTGTVVHGNNTRTNLSSDIALGGGAIEWGNIISTSFAFLRTTAPTIFNASIRQSLLAATQAQVVAGIDASLYNAVAATVSSACLVGLPTNPAGGLALTYTFIQDATGGWAVTWNAIFKGLTWSNAGNTAGKRSSITFTYDGATGWNAGPQSPWA